MQAILHDGPRPDQQTVISPTRSCAPQSVLLVHADGSITCVPVPTSGTSRYNQSDNSEVLGSRRSFQRCACSMRGGHTFALAIYSCSACMFALSVPVHYPAACAGLPSLLEGSPDLAQQWHPTRNGQLKPSDVSSGCTSKVYWLCTACPCGFPHVWQSLVANRARPPFSGCPFCSGRQPCACRSLAVLRPEVVAQWDHSGNGDLRPEDVTISSARKVQWICHSHSPAYTWSATVKNRTKALHPTKCPLCSRAEAVRKTSELLLLARPLPSAR